MQKKKIKSLAVQTGQSIQPTTSQLVINQVFENWEFEDIETESYILYIHKAENGK